MYTGYVERCGWGEGGCILGMWRGVGGVRVGVYWVLHPTNSFEPSSSSAFPAMSKGFILGEIFA